MSSPLQAFTDDLTGAITHGAPGVRRRAMAKAITLLESTRADHRAQGDELLTALLAAHGQGVSPGHQRRAGRG